MTDLTAEELRIVILKKCDEAAKAAADPVAMAVALRRAAELLDEYERRKAPQ